jgi:Rps23 Pro-64 3,4-dihydroxylase Tpa1-like proline 4-hydroxylase
MGVNSRWTKDCGGELVIETSEGTQTIYPQSGQAIIFTTRNQWHEVKPVANISQSRKTLALFAWEASKQIVGSTGADFGGGLTSAS